MSNKTNPNHSNNAVARTDNHDVAKKAGSQSMDEKYDNPSFRKDSISDFC